jgi:hypothetical protein
MRNIYPVFPGLRNSECALNILGFNSLFLKIKS